jgi:hypothetical protein
MKSAIFRFGVLAFAVAGIPRTKEPPSSLRRKAVFTMLERVERLRAAEQYSPPPADRCGHRRGLLHRN